MASLESVVSILTALYEHCEKVKTLGEVCGRLRSVVGVFRPLLSAYIVELRGRTEPPWINALETALREALEAVRTCASNPVKTKLFPSSYTGKLETARTKIRDAIEAISLTNATVGQQAKDAVLTLSNDFQELETHIQSAREENEVLVQQMMDAMKHNQEELLNAIAQDYGLADAAALRSQLVRTEAELKNIKKGKDAASQQELAAALALSKMASASMCPDNFRCAITLEIMDDPHILVQSGMTYEKKAIQHALIENPNMDPMTGPFEGEAKLVPNYGLRGVIQQWREQGMRSQANEGGGGGGGGGGGAAQEYPDELVAWFSDLKISEAKTHEVLDYLCGDEVGATEVGELAELRPNP